VFIYQDGKLYIRKGEDKLVGVSISPTGVTEHAGEVTKVGKNYRSMEMFEVQRAFHIIDGETYDFPVKKVKAKPKTNAKR
jgi:hypothetical protein